MNFNEMVCPFECKCTMSAPIHDPKQNIHIQSYDLNAINGRKLLEREKKMSLTLVLSLRACGQSIPSDLSVVLRNPPLALVF